MEEKATKGQRPPKSDAQSPANKKRFRVWAETTQAHYIELFAASAAEAQKLAEEDFWLTDFQDQ